MIYTAPCIMFWSFFGPKWHSPINSVPFHRARPLPLALVMDMHASKPVCIGLYKSEVHWWFYVQEPTREVSRPILWGGGGRCKAPPIQNLLEIKRKL
jgi:hypothetical protein